MVLCEFSWILQQDYSIHSPPKVCFTFVCVHMTHNRIKTHFSCPNMEFHHIFCSATCLFYLRIYQKKMYIDSQIDIRQINKRKPNLIAYVCGINTDMEIPKAVKQNEVYIPPSVGILDPRASPTQLNAVEFLWDPSKRASAFIQVHCISTEFTPRKHGGRGVPFRVQIDTFKQNENGEYTEHWHSASCQIKVFKPKGADRKQKTDWEKMEKRTAQEKEKYQPSYETTILTEPWCRKSLSNSQQQSSARTCIYESELRPCSPWPDMAYQVNSAPSPSYNGSPNSFGLGEGPGAVVSGPFLSLCLQHLLPSASIQDAQQWLHRKRFSQFCRLFASFSGADLLKMSRDDLVQICGPADGIRLFNAIKGRNVRPKMTIYVCQELEQNRAPLQQKRDGGDSSLCVYHAIFLEELTTLELVEKIANLYSISPQHIHRVYRQGPTGIHVVVSNEMVQNFQDESCFILSTLKAESNDGYHIILKCGLRAEVECVSQSLPLPAPWIPLDVEPAPP
ncbi:unnamed protein product [Nyctereutes procyonoides]|uniref:(raccoon dog) hypothetical protein n=1 Tax=Nyctereutes procyonoides TaxID=34880 RepID=A0A811XWI4_NYCPR|nr:unnamed protein product [Nyctereutes procyonoides]